MKHVALVGVSGVGKSTFLRRCSETLDFLHLEASSLIKDQKQIIEGAIATSEELRTGAVLNNQELLVSAYRRKTQSQDRLCVLDGHTVIDTGRGLQNIPSAVFVEMGIQKFLVLTAQPYDLSRRRALDTGRTRPDRNIAQLDDYQQSMVKYTNEVASIMNIPVEVIDGDAPVTVLTAN